MLPQNMGPLGLAAVSLLVASTTAQSTGRPGHGLIGLGITMYQPACAFACRSALPRSSIPCHTAHQGHHSSTVSADCLAESDAFLLSTAWCIHTHCPDENVSVAALEKFWEIDLVGREEDQPLPKWSYQESLSRVIDDPPTEYLEEEAVFNVTVLAVEEDYVAEWNGNSAFETVEGHNTEYSLILVLTGAGIPILMSLLRFLPFPPALVSKFHAYVIEPPAFGKSHAAPILGLGLVPTRGQAIFIFYLIALNVILSAVGYEPRRPNSWYSMGMYEEMTNYVANRFGVLSFANLPLVILYAGRNNILLWVTNWSHSTFLLVHRWIAFICMLQAALHSALWLHIHLVFYEDHNEVAILAYWYWGIIGTLALVLLVPLSILPIRKRMYEVFHAMHIVLAIIAIAGCWYHIIYRYERQWGYENWVIAASVVWAFEWVMRAARLLGSSVKRGYVTRISDDYICLEVPGAICHGHAYAYFPTLTWRVWESHPFSVAGVVYHENTGPDFNYEDKLRPHVVSKSLNAPSLTFDSDFRNRDGARFFIRIEKGTTSLLAACHGRKEGIPLLLEAYSGESVFQEPEQPNAIFIAGGVGITAILPKIRSSFSSTKVWGSKKLYWGVRSGATGLVEAVQEMVIKPEMGEEPIAIRSEGQTHLQWGEVDVQVSVGERLDLRALLEADIGAAKEGVTVVVCGPADMTDEVRTIVTSLGRHGAVVQLSEESFMW